MASSFGVRTASGDRWIPTGATANHSPKKAPRDSRLMFPLTGPGEEYLGVALGWHSAGPVADGFGDA